MLRFNVQGSNVQSAADLTTAKAPRWNDEAQGESMSDEDH
jgi:hypothetical protein